ncbi:MAG: 3-methyl-2-oxobutanoate hydroxymethyltransferase [Isosphaeraceae bacterium]|nr:3-methyl-2-oxobutanoate hydroxymethyltransferase [Isosphaeraceae bacterium]
MSDAAPLSSPVRLPDFARWKLDARKIAVLTAYDFTTARIFDQAGVDCLLVGDSLGTVVQGWDTTLRVTLDQMIYHTEMVARAAKHAFVVADLPFGSYQAGPSAALESATRLFKETECQAVKLEGGRSVASTISTLVEAGIPVMGHVGLTPQSVRRLGGFKVQRDVARIEDDAHAAADAGAFALVLECIPTEAAERITRSLPIPTIGIGAGPHCDGQVLVAHDFLGLFDAFRPKFVRRYLEAAPLISAAAAAYIADVQSGRFPSESESFK